MAKKILMAIFMIFSLESANAEIYFQVTKKEGGLLWGKFYYEMLEWTTDDNKPNPCYNNLNCTMMITSSYNASGYPSDSDGYWEASKVSWVASSRTMGELGENFKRNVGLPRAGGFAYNRYLIVGGACVGLFYRSDVVGVIKRMPGSICANPPEGNVSCDIVTPSLTLNHGVINIGEVEGNTASESLNITCNKKSNIQLFISEGVNGLALNETGTLRTNLKINGQPAGPGVDLVIEPTGRVVQVSSTLKSVGDISPGVFNASAVAVLSIL
ncbi:TPA: exotoxin [Serratia marcescens]|uniref:MrpH family fimbial adhesin n=1 Tax=Serratia sp. CY29653 TaxID=3383594 RepID=UPI001A1CB789|nr:exotoxin [Serratia marcescens]HAT4976645.1 exotoxin [Serratia marcescens]HAT4990631.1 exotoxin [Serratia marcescens]HAT5049270.1 exotoxin [Serratia marcescens]HEJ7079750.1 exotoxin [Serratia marcescens]